MAARRRRLGVMGGTFDPIHHGHLVAASEVQSWFDLDEVVFVPTGRPWQKSGRDVSPPEHRYLMTVVATAAEVPKREVGANGPSSWKPQEPLKGCSMIGNSSIWVKPISRT